MQRQPSQEADVPKQNEQVHHTNVVANRTGEVLIKHTLLKSDHFPGDPVLGCCSSEPS